MVTWTFIQLIFNHHLSCFGRLSMTLCIVSFPLSFLLLNHDAKFENLYIEFSSTKATYSFLLYPFTHLVLVYGSRHNEVNLQPVGIEMLHAIQDSDQSTVPETVPYYYSFPQVSQPLRRALREFAFIVIN